MLKNAPDVIRFELPWPTHCWSRKREIQFCVVCRVLTQWYDSKYKNFEEFKNILPILVSEEVWTNIFFTYSYIEFICCKNTNEWRIFCCSLVHYNLCIQTKFDKTDRILSVFVCRFNYLSSLLLRVEGWKNSCTDLKIPWGFKYYWGTRISRQLAH